MFDEELVYKRFVEETNNDEWRTDLYCRTIKTLHPALNDCILAWLNKEFKDFEFKGVTLNRIMEKEECSHISAIYAMCVFLENPELELAENYESYEYAYHGLGEDDYNGIGEEDFEVSQ